MTRSKMTEDLLAHKYSKEHKSATFSPGKLFVRLLSYIKPYRQWAFLSLLLLVVARTIDVIVPIYIGSIVQRIVTGVNFAQVEKQHLFNGLMQEGFYIFLLLIGGYLVDLLSMVIKNWIGQKALFNLRTEVYRHIQDLPMERFDYYPIGRYMTRTIHDIDQINQMFTESVIPLIGSLILFFGMAIGMAIVNWKIAAAFYLILPFVSWLAWHFQYYQRYCYEMIRNIVSAMNTFFQEYLSGTSTIRGFGLEHKEKKRFDEFNRDHCEANMRAADHFSFFIAGIDLLQSLAFILAFTMLILFIPTNTLFEAGVFFTFSLYALMFFRPIIDLADRYNILQSAIAAADRVFTTLDKPIENIGDSSAFEVEEIDSIAFENVWFAYEEEHWILKDLSFEIKRGESIALIGLTGSGKSTIISLLMRFYDYQKGSIKINGREIRDYPLHKLRRLFSVVLQEPVLFSGTLADNISLFNPNIRLDQMEQLIKNLKMQSFIEKFPKGLMHQLQERGGGLSVGERQLISLLRAIVHRQTMMMFDEATANIDTMTEKMIQNALSSVLASQTALIIAHRLSTIRGVNRIIVLHHGEIKEVGSHQELLQSKGLYEKLYRLSEK